MATDEQRRAFVQGKMKELADYMVTQGWDYGKTGGTMLGMAAGWVAATYGNPVAYQALDMAQAAIEKHTGTKKDN